MTTLDDADLAAVREAVAARVDADQPDIASVWSRVVAGASRREPRVPAMVTGRLLPVAAAVAVIAVAVGVAVSIGPRDPEPDLPAAVFPPVDRVGPARPIAPDQALAEMLAAAESAEPVDLTEGQLVYVHTEAAVWFRGPSQDWSHVVGRPDELGIHETWFEPEGRIVVAGRSTSSDGSFGTDGHDGIAEVDPDEVARQRMVLDRDGPSLLQPTPAWLAGLADDPANLRRLLVERGEVVAGPDAEWSEDRKIFDAIGELVSYTEPLLTPQLRRELYRLLFGLDGIATAEVAYESYQDGRRLIVVSHSEHDTTMQMFLDPATGRMVGGGWVDDRFPVTSEIAGTYNRGWSTYAVVDEVGATG